MSLIFVVSTGRCGSNLVSRLLNVHPEVLSLSELFGLVPMAGRLTGRMDGAQFWKRLADPVPFIDGMVLDGVPLPELVYPYATGRFKPQAGVPFLSHMVLPMLSAEPDELFDKLAAAVPRWPVRAVPDHFRHFFAWLAHEFGRAAVVERSGGSIRHVAELHQAFPEARFVYLSRDGVDCALSMSKHAGFRIPVLVEVARATGRWLSTPIEPPRFDAKSIMEASIPLDRFGALWSAMTCAGVEALRQLPPTAWFPLRYEDLLNTPEATLRTLVRSLGVATPPEWLTWATAQVHPPRCNGFARLDPDVLAQLREACAPGYEAQAQLLAVGV